MKIININSYYIGSSLYKHLESALQERSINIATFVPISENNKIKNVENHPPHVNTKILFNNLDRIFYRKKQDKILNYFLGNYNVTDKTILHAHSLFTNGYIAYQNYIKNKTPYIVAVRNTDLNIFFRYMVHLRRTGIEILYNAEKVVFISKSYKDDTLNKYVPDKLRTSIKSKSVVIPNGIDPFWFDNIYKEKAITSDFVNLLYVGQLSKGKNIITLINACEKLIKQGVNLKLNVVGEKVSNRIFKKVNQTSCINYLGVLNKEELLKKYRMNDIFVLPSKRETFGLVYPEAMSQGLPVIYTKGQGFDKYFPEGEVGYSVSATNSDDIVNKILLTIENYDEITKDINDKAKLFDWKRISKLYENIYYSINRNR